MRSITKIAMVAVAFGGLLAIPRAFAQRHYDTKTVETVSGKVLSVEKTTRPEARSQGIHLMFQTDKETLLVALGPAWYIDKQPPRIEANDAITVTGSRVVIDGKAAIIAAEVKKGDQILKLRDGNGIPAWSGGGRGGRR